MNQYDYTAQFEDGTSISGTMEAGDGSKVVARLESMSLNNIEVCQTAAPAARPKLGSDDFIFFNEQLAGLASAGICLDAGLRQMAHDIKSRRLRDVLNAVAGDIENGKPLEDALDGHASQMPALYSRVVRAGIETGQLPATLLNLSHHLRLVASARRVIVESLTYPAIVLVLAMALLSAIVMIIVPSFAESFQDFGVALPALTRAAIELAQWLPSILTVLVGLALISWVLWIVLRFKPWAMRFRERVAMMIPIIGAMLRNSLRARFLRAMAFGVDAGIPLPECLRLSSGATASQLLIGEAEQVAANVESGSSVYAACQKLSVIPAMLGYLLDLHRDGDGQRDALIQLARTYESGAAHEQSLLRAWLAPLGVIIVGIVIGFVVTALFLPLMSILHSVQG
ncbi:MAG: type II secretion system F family protein [Planctomycetota bacterium]|jgi:type II secretory pathway component PulF